ncbi:AAEL017202-PA, partial [Aedes aegypti]
MPGVTVAENVLQAIAPCEVVCKLFGLIPLFSGIGLPVWKRCLNAGHFLVTISMIIGGIFYCLPMEMSHDAGSSVARKSGAIITVVYYFQPICATVTSRLIAGTTYEIFKSLESVDNKLKTIGYGHSSIREKKAISRSTACALAGSSGVLLMFAAHPLEMDVFFTFVNIFFVVHFSMAGTYASCVAYLILNRFQVVKDVLSTKFPICMTADKDVSIVSKPVIRIEEQEIALKQVKFVLDKLNSTIELMNQSLAIQVLYCVGVSFVIGIVCSFYLFRAVIYRNDQLAMGAINFIWYMYYLSFVLFFIAIASRISQEGRRIGITVHKAINFCNTSRTVINELIIFSQQLLHHNPVITCGLFVYDWSLLYTMLGATATYLIILIQFDVSFPSLDVGNSTTSSL